MLVGIIDLVRPGGKIVDFKTSSTTPQPDRSSHQNELQLTCYGVLYREATGVMESGFELHHLVKLKTHGRGLGCLGCECFRECRSWAGTEERRLAA